MSRHRAAVGWVVASIACVAVACTTSTERSLIRILQQRGPHLRPPEHAEIAAGLIRAERSTGIDALLLLAVVEEESHFRTRARSRRGALGLLQVRPETAREVARSHGIPWSGDSSLTLRGAMGISTSIRQGAAKRSPKD